MAVRVHVARAVNNTCSCGPCVRRGDKIPRSGSTIRQHRRNELQLLRDQALNERAQRDGSLDSFIAEPGMRLHLLRDFAPG